MNSKHRFILNKLLTFEFVLLNVILVLFLYLRLPEFSLANPDFQQRLIEIAVVYNLSWLLIILYIRDNEFYFNPNYNYIKSLVISVFSFVGIVITLIVAFKIRHFARSTYIIPIFIFSYLNLVSQKYLLRYLKNKASHLFSDTLLLSSGDSVPQLNAFIQAMAQYGYNIMGHLTERQADFSKTSGLRIMGGAGTLPQVLRANSINEIFIDMSNMPKDTVSWAVSLADEHGIRVKLIPDNPVYMSRNYKAVTLGELSVFKLRQSPLDSFNMMVIKRIFDFLFALVTLILLSPIFLIIAILIRIDSPGSVIYAPNRKGEGGATFRCFKFRTMYTDNSPNSGTQSTKVNDPRITRIGRILRKSDLDELPQFVNVLRGEMSVIGPRPHRVNLQNDLRQHVRNYMVRSYVKPGITGWAQVNGWRGPTVTEQEKQERIKHDLWYIENWSLWLDIKIVFLTVFGRHRKNAF